MLALFLLYVFLVWVFSGHDFFQVIGIEASCDFPIICFQFINFEQLHSILSDCTRFITFLLSPYAVLFLTYFSLLLAEFDSSVYISIQLSRIYLCKVSTEDSYTSSYRWLSSLLFLTKMNIYTINIKTTATWHHNSYGCRG